SVQLVQHIILRARDEPLGAEDVPAAMRSVADLHVITVEADSHHYTLAGPAARKDPGARKPRPIASEPAGDRDVGGKRGAKSARELAAVDIEPVGQDQNAAEIRSRQLPRDRAGRIK